MNTVEYRFLEPLDVLFLRGNKLFGDPGSYGESLVPPWPSVAAGAIRSRMLADDGVDLAAFAAGRVAHAALGTPERPGSFALLAFHLARRHADGHVEALVAAPADLVISDDDTGKPESVRPLNPTLPAAGLRSSAPLPRLPVLAESTRGKPAAGYWLTETGWRRYLSGEIPAPADLVKSGVLWQIDARVGVGLDAATRRAADGRLFSVQAVAMVKRGHRIGTKPGSDEPSDASSDPALAEFDVGFLAAVTGAQPPTGGTVRLGGDGRGAAVHAVVTNLPEPDYDAIAHARRCRLVLTSPGIFPQGWRLPGMDSDGVFGLGDIKGRVVCAAVPRAEVVSGWDLAKWQPKAALRAVPSGSVYWVEELETSAEQLRKLAAAGLWGDSWDHPQRRAEGFNRLTFAAWR